MSVRRPAGLALDLALIALAVLVANAPLPPGWIERGYANGMFARLNMVAVPVTNAMPFALGDAFAAVLGIGLITAWIVTLRRARGRRIAASVELFAHTCALLALVTIAFEVLWAWNYRRVPVAARVAYDPARVTAANVDAFAERIERTLNADVAAAHARAAVESEPAMRAQLARDFAPVVARLGDTWPVALPVPKHTVADIVYEMAGVGGLYDPYTFETLLNASFLPVEIPRALAHEWSHAAGFGDEGDANLIGTVACLRSPDPLIRYSGAFWTYAELPERNRARFHLAPAVIADFNASRARFLKYYQPRLFAFSWRIYDSYLLANHVAGGVASYSRFIRLLVGTPFDREGLPLRALGFRPAP